MAGRDGLANRLEHPAPDRYRDRRHPIYPARGLWLITAGLPKAQVWPIITHYYPY